MNKPNFFIIGAPRAEMMILSEYLKGYPQSQLISKNIMPFPRFVAGVLARQTVEAWAGDYYLSDESGSMRNLVGGGDFDLLDVRPSSGRLLEAFSDAESEPRMPSGKDKRFAVAGWE